MGGLGSAKRDLSDESVKWYRELPTGGKFFNWLIIAGVVAGIGGITMGARKYRKTEQTRGD
jgi:hypothetical protein